MPKTIIIASHRRSGTHLTIDAIYNNFASLYQNATNDFVTLDHLSSHVQRKSLTLQQVRDRVSRDPCLLKTHTHGNWRNFFIGSEELTAFVSELFEKSKIIYVHRDGRDVLTSLYHYQQVFDESIRRLSFSDYIRMPNSFDHGTYEGEMNRVQYWAFHIESWLNKKGCLMISFDDLHSSYVATLRRIAEFIEEPLNNDMLDVRLQASSTPAPSELTRKTSYTTVNFRKGTSGDWKKHFSGVDVDFFDAIAGETNRRLGYR